MQLNLDRQTAGGCARHLLAAFHSGSEERIGQAFDTIGGIPLPATMDSQELEFRDVLAGVMEPFRGPTRSVFEQSAGRKAAALQIIGHLARTAA